MPHFKKYTLDPLKCPDLENKSGSSSIFENRSKTFFIQIENGRRYFIVKSKPKIVYNI